MSKQVFRQVVVNDVPYACPQRIQRIDNKRTHGWQLRWQGTMLFSDGIFGGARASLNAASVELVRRLGVTPPENVHPGGRTKTRMLHKRALSHKSSSLPVGVCGPTISIRRGVVSFDFQVSCPDPNKPVASRNTTVYIASAQTMSRLRYQRALDKAISIRNAKAADYEAKLGG